MAKTNTTSLAIFNQIDFSPLHEAIEKLSQTSTALTSAEQHDARNLIMQWETNILEQLNHKAYSIRDFLSEIECRSYDDAMFDETWEHYDRVQAMIQHSSALKKLWKAAKTAREAYDECRIETESLRAEEPHLDLNSTLEESLEATIQHKHSVRKKEVRLANIEYKYKAAKRQFCLALRKDKDIIEFCKSLRATEKNMYIYRQEASHLAQTAKLNISIQDPNVHAVLKEMLNFRIAA